jgi:hypothetical protein
MPEHLILARQHLRLSLVKGTLVTEQRPVTALSANGRCPEAGRGVSARRPRPALYVGAGHLHGVSMVGEDWRPGKRGARR